MTLPMSWDEWAQHDGVALAARVSKGELTARELAQQAAAGIAKVNPPLSAVVEVFDDAVADPAGNGANADGPFAGLPFLMKDLGPTMKGRLQEMGSLIMRGNRATSDTFLTGKFRQAGLNLIGRTTTPEFGVCSSAENPAVYVTRNPWNTDYTTCGSSAGSAAMVAAGALPIAHATDGGGSIRIPAGVNGNIGLKVSRGVFSLAPQMSDLTGLVSIQGCQSRSVRDTAAFVDACRGPAPGEFMPFWTTPEPYTEMIKRDPGRLAHRALASMGRVSRHAADRGRTGAGRKIPRRPRPSRRLRAARARLSRRVRGADDLLHQQFCAGDRQHAGRARARSAAGRSDRAHQHQDLGSTAGTPALPNGRMQAVFNTTSRGFGAFFEQWDIILTPITALPTPKVGTTEYLTISDNPSVLDWFANLWRNFAFTPLANLCGIPGDLAADGHARARTAARHPGDRETGQ